MIPPLDGHCVEVICVWMSMNDRCERIELQLIEPLLIEEDAQSVPMPRSPCLQQLIRSMSAWMKQFGILVCITAVNSFFLFCWR